MNPINLDDYVDVPERIRLFNEKYPEGTLQGSGVLVYEGDKIVGYVYTAKAYRHPDDPRPGMGTAFEPIPGKTPYTRDSEVMNAETSAWGRAIVAVGIPSKRIASANEVASRAAVPEAPVGLPVDNKQHARIGALVKELGENSGEGSDWVSWSRNWCFDHYGKRSRAELTHDEADALIVALVEQLEIAKVPFGR